MFNKSFYQLVNFKNLCINFGNNKGIYNYLHNNAGNASGMLCTNSLQYKKMFVSLQKNSSCPPNDRQVIHRLTNSLVYRALKYKRRKRKQIQRELFFKCLYVSRRKVDLFTNTEGDELTNLELPLLDEEEDSNSAMPPPFYTV